MSKSKFRRLGVLLVCFLAGAGLGYAIFKYETPSGYITLTYDGLAASGVYLVLANQSSQTIYIRRGSENVVWPGWARTTCILPDVSSAKSDSVNIADGPINSIGVRPGARLRLEVATVLPAQHRYSHCRVRIDLLGGTFVESEEFTAT